MRVEVALGDSHSEGLEQMQKTFEQNVGGEISTELLFLRF